jgi:site-specific DNA recombinase
VPDAPLRALIYNRVSVAKGDDHVSTDSQHRENQAFCQRQGWAVAGVVTDDDRSASRYAVRRREGYARVKRALAGEGYGRIDVLVAWEASRLARDAADAWELRQLCADNRVRLAYKGRTYDLTDGDDRFTTGLDALLAERESEMIRDRVLRSHRDSRQAGKPRGSIPYGYRRVYDDASGRLARQEPDPETAPVIQEIVRRILAGESLYRIAKSLNNRAVITPQARRDQRRGDFAVRPGWSSSQIRNVLSRRGLMGVREHKGQAVGDAAWDAIVSPADWDAVRRLLGDPTRQSHTHGVAPVHLLSGIAECGVCGAWLRPYTLRGKPTYRCAGLTPTASKAHVSRARQPLDAMVTAFMVALLGRPDVVETLAAAAGTADTEQAAAAREAADLEVKLAELEEAAGSGGISFAAFGRLEARLLEQLETARARATPAWMPPAVRDLAGPDAAARWAGVSLEVRRAAVRCLVRVVVDPVARRGVRGFDFSTVSITRRGGS